MKTKPNRSNIKIVLRFIAIILASLVVGGALGYGIASAETGIVGVLNAFASWLTTYAFWLTLAAFLLFVLGWLCYCKGRTYAAKAQTEDTLEAAERWYSYGLNFSSIFMVVLFMLFGFAVAGFQTQQVQPSLLFQVVAFLVGLAAVIVLQGWIVKATKELNPEKRGHILDTKFQKDWYSSCDEAERQMIGRAAYKSMQATGTAYSFVFLACVLLAMALPIGPWPFLVIGVLWLVQLESYQLECLRLSKPKTNAK